VLVSIVTVAFNSGPLLTEVVRSAIGNAGDVPVEMIVVDNGDHGPEIDAAAALGATVISGHGNIGFPAGCDLGVAASSGEIVIFLNPDAQPRAEWIAPLVARLAEPGVGSVQSLLCFADRPDVVNTTGCVIHLTGSGWMGGFGLPVSSVSGPMDITYAGGAALAMRRSTYDEVGGFCGEYFLYHEDLELGWRVRLAGYRAVLEPASVVDHSYEFSRNAAKYYFIERNRMMFVATCFPAALILAVAPVMAGFELAILVSAARDGWLREILRGWRWCFAHRDWIRRRRREVLDAAVVEVGEMSSWLTAPLDPGMIDLPAGVDVVNALLRAYWRVARRLLGPAAGSRQPARPRDV
jgi:GT2 family glycosyltransferase